MSEVREFTNDEVSLLYWCVNFCLTMQPAYDIEIRKSELYKLIAYLNEELIKREQAK